MMGMSGTQTAHDLESAVNTVASPVESFVNNIADTAGSYWSALTQIDRLRTQNEQLKQDNLTLQEELDRMGAISQISDDWTQITVAAAGIPYQTTPVRVIVRDISGVTKSLIIDKGSNYGMVKGQVVIDAGGALVGRVQAVDPTVSKILLISDPSSVVVGKEAQSGATGKIQGSVSGLLEMDYVDVAATLTKDEPVVTAGEALTGTCDISPFPPGLLIGKITDVSVDPNAVVKSATIAPAGHLTDATFLLVITNYQGGFAPTPTSGPSVSPGSSSSPGASATPSSSRSATPGSSVSAVTGCPQNNPTPLPSVKPSAKPSS